MRDYICQGCGKSWNYWSGKKPVLCENCIRAIKEYPKLTKSIQNNKDNIIVLGKAVDYAYPYISLEQSYEDAEGERIDFADYFHKVVERLSKEVAWEDLEAPGKVKGFFSKKDYGGSRDHEFDRPISINKEDYETLREMYLFVKQLADDQYQEGFRKGKQLLLSLNSGQITLKEFDKTLQ